MFVDYRIKVFLEYVNKSVDAITNCQFPLAIRDRYHKQYVGVIPID